MRYCKYDEAKKKCTENINLGLNGVSVGGESRSDHGEQLLDLNDITFSRETTHIEVVHGSLRNSEQRNQSTLSRTH